MTPAPLLQLFSGLALKDTLEDGLLAAFCERHGVTIDARYEPTSVLVELIQAGARPDVLIGVRTALQRLAAEGLLGSNSLRPVVRSGLGVAVAGGAPHPVIDSEAQFRRAVLGARAVAYSRSGASGIYFGELLSRWAVTNEVNSRAVIFDKGFTAEALVDGRADIAVQQLSELATVGGIEIVGPFPAAAQHYVELDAGAHRDAAPVATALIDYLRGPEAVNAFRRAQMEPVS